MRMFKLPYSALYLYYHTEALNNSLVLEIVHILFFERVISLSEMLKALSE